MVRGAIAGVALVLLATACSMEGRIRRRGAFAVCDASPMVEPWLSQEAEAKRARRFAEAVYRGSAGSVRTRPLAAAEVAALVGRVPQGYGHDVVMLEVTFALAAGSPSQLSVGTRTPGASVGWQQPSYEELHALFGVTPPPKDSPPSRKTVMGGSLFVLTLGLVDIDDRWGSLLGERAPDPSEDTRAGRDAASEAFMLELPRHVKPGATVTRHLLVARTEGTGPVELELEIQPWPDGCVLFLPRRTELALTVPSDAPSVVTFDGEDLLPLAEW